MCGILAILGEDVLCNETLEKLRVLIGMRGPDYCSPFLEHKTRCGLKMKLTTSILHLRGDEMQQQPVVDEFGNILMFNGQIYEYSGNPLEQEVSDTKFLMNTLKLCRSQDDIANAFAAIDGPFAFVYWHDNFSTLFYGRDLFGRKSLCTLHCDLPYPQCIASLAMQDTFQSYPWVEVDCTGFHCLTFGTSSQPTQTKYVWNIDLIYPPTKKCQNLVDPGVEIDYIPLKSIPIAPLKAEIEPHCTWDLALENFKHKLIQAVRKRIIYNRDTCLVCRRSRPILPTNQLCNHSKVAIAFSGGVDSTLLALILDLIYDKTETIDLLTVAFKSESPDRKSVHGAFKELRRICPNRNWRLVLADVTKSDLQDERSKTIRHLILPCNTVIDDSLGCACWFIGRGKGRCMDVSSINDDEFDEALEVFIPYSTSFSYETKTKFSDKICLDYTCPATMLFVGSGIDEQLGGYSSHRAAWSSSGAKGVHDEISFQMRRISTRNLGRDDRTYSHHGRDVKLPYLDYDLVSYLNQLPVGLKMNLDKPLGIGPKKLLRDLAAQMGLQETSTRVKRALQFGTRIANLEDSSEKGNDICYRLT